MLIAALIAGLHYLGIMTLAATLLLELVTLRGQITREAIERLARTDLMYGMAAILVLATGLLRLTEAYGRGPAFYMHNGVFHLKVTLFVLVGIISIAPTMRFLRWRRTMLKDNSLPDAGAVAGTRKLVMAELHILFLIPFLAALMVRI